MERRLFALRSWAFRMSLCSLKVRCSSSINPTYLVWCWYSYFRPFRIIFPGGSSVSLFLNTITSVFVLFNDILFARSQCERALRSLFNFLNGFLLSFLIIWIILVSSAKCLVVEVLIHWGRSLMYTRVLHTRTRSQHHER